MNQVDFNHSLLLARDNSAQLQMASRIMESPQEKPLLLEALRSNDVHVSQRASAVAVLLLSRDRSFFSEEISNLLQNLNDSSTHSQKRTLVRVLEQAFIPEENQGELYEKCMGLAINPNYPTAVRAYSLGILTKIASNYPELALEIIQVLDDIREEPELSAGMQSRTKNCKSTLQSVVDLA